MSVNLSAASAVAPAKGYNLSASVEGWSSYIISYGGCWAASLIEQL